MKQVKFKTNINCENCLATVTPFLNRLEEVETWRVDLSNPDKVLQVELSGDDSHGIKQAVQEAGFSIDQINN